MLELTFYPSGAVDVSATSKSKNNIQVLIYVPEIHYILMEEILIKQDALGIVGTRNDNTPNFIFNDSHFMTDFKEKTTIKIVARIIEEKARSFRELKLRSELIEGDDNYEIWSVVAEEGDDQDFDDLTIKFNWGWVAS